MFVHEEHVVTMCFGLCCWFWACYVRSSLLAVDTRLMRFSALHLYIRWTFCRTTAYIPRSLYILSLASLISLNFFSAAKRMSSPKVATRSGWCCRAILR